MQNRPMQNATDPSAPPQPDVAKLGSTPQGVLVTGGTGFIGTALISQLLADGHTVTAWTRDAKAARSRLGTRVRCVGRLEELAPTDRCDVVINLAGARIVGPRWTDRRKTVLMQSRQGLTQGLVDWIGTREQRPWLMLSGSAIGYYGIQAQGDRQGLTEAAPPKDVFMSRLCTSWEQAARGAETHGVKVVCTRFGVVLGQGGGSTPQLLLPIKLGVGGRLGSGQQWMSWIHLHDLIRALAHVWQLAEHATPGLADAYNFTAPKAVSQEEFGKVAAQILHRPFWSWIPAAPVRLALGEQADLLLEGQRVVPQRLLDSGFRFAYADVGSALTDICR